MTLKAPYILALCEAAQQSSVTFGMATRLGAQNQSFNVDAAKVIHSIVTFSPATESVAIDFLNEFQKVSCLHHLGSASLLFEYLPFADAALVASVLSGEADADADQWAQDVLMAVRDLDPQQLPVALKPVLDLASEYLTHLLIAGLSCIMKLTCHLLYRVIRQFEIRVAERHRKCLHVPLEI
jgi:hypothetical protein